MKYITIEYLSDCGLFELRDIARNSGIISPSLYSREELIEKILNILGKIPTDKDINS